MVENIYLLKKQFGNLDNGHNVIKYTTTLRRYSLHWSEVGKMWHSSHYYSINTLYVLK